MLVDLLAVASAVTALALAAALPLASDGALGARAVAGLLVATAVAFVAGASALLSRALARPVDRMLTVAERLGAARDGDLPLLAPPGEDAGHGLSRAALAFERIALALDEERARLRAKVAEVEAANRALAQADESLARSERLATVGRLAAGVAHEVGNPLGAITGYAELARARIRAGAAGDAADLVDRIAAEAGRIDRIVRDLLDFARPAPPVRTPVRVATAVEAAIRLARVQSRFRDVAVTVEIPDAFPPVVADEGRLAQVFLNLFLNAGDAMEGRGSLRVSAREEGADVEVSVADSGPGIAAADLPRIFDPFFTTKPPGAGTGLGLAMCHRLMESMGGRITAANIPEGGAVFTIALVSGAQPG